MQVALCIAKVGVLAAGEVVKGRGKELPWANNLEPQVSTATHFCCMLWALHFCSPGGVWGGPGGFSWPTWLQLGVPRVSLTCKLEELSTAAASKPISLDFKRAAFPQGTPGVGRGNDFQVLFSWILAFSDPNPLLLL